MGGKNRSPRSSVRVDHDTLSDLHDLAADMARAVEWGRAERTWDGDDLPPLGHVIARLIAFRRDYEARRRAAAKRRKKGAKHWARESQRPE